ncbi:MAG: hypothetical protein HeimC3_41410 [Candidatus Heimdallarchaeota archaeon LC_3]|nr:MAG: hypothetical protein HeimC3_41410 [Candidatus Heimdallarchaeota archaeon LC_3]
MWKKGYQIKSKYHLQKYLFEYKLNKKWRKNIKIKIISLLIYFLSIISLLIASCNILFQLANEPLNFDTFLKIILDNFGPIVTIVFLPIILLKLYKFKVEREIKKQIENENKYHFKKRDKNFPLDLDDLKLSPLMIENSYEKVYSPDRKNIALCSPIINDLLIKCQIDNIPLIFQEKAEFKLDDIAEEILFLVLNKKLQDSEKKILFNDEKMRLLSDLTIKNLKEPNVINLQKTNYFQSVGTNEMTGKRIIQKKRKFKNKEPFIFLNKFSFMAEKNIAFTEEKIKQLYDLENSYCSNHIGVNTIAITNDKKIVIGEQTEHGQQAINQLAPSGSGSADYKDFKPINEENNFIQCILDATNRELKEECNLKHLPHKTMLIGFTRLLNRGGKPDFFSISYLKDISSEDIKKARIARKEKPFVKKIMFEEIFDFNPIGITKALDNIYEKYKNRISFALYLNIEILRFALKEVNFRKSFFKSSY